jgi:prolipoprotein diacylglyceryltransferase
MGKNWLIAGVLWVAGARFSLRPGVITWAFIALYGFIRFWLMFVRDETRIWLGMTQSQVFSGIMAIVGVVMVVALMRRGPAPVGQSRAGPAST